MDKRKQIPEQRKTGSKKKAKKTGLKLSVELVAVIGIVAVIVMMLISGKALSSEDLREGVSYIKALEAKSTAEVENRIKEIEKA